MPRESIEILSSSYIPCSRNLFYLAAPELYPFIINQSLVGQGVKRLPAMWETRIQSLGWEDPLERGMVTHSSILAWRIPWTEEPSRLWSMGSQRVGHD